MNNPHFILINKHFLPQPFHSNLYSSPGCYTVCSLGHNILTYTNEGEWQDNRQLLMQDEEDNGFKILKEAQHQLNN